MATAKKKVEKKKTKLKALKNKKTKKGVKKNGNTTKPNKTSKPRKKIENEIAQENVNASKSEPIGEAIRCV